MVIVGPNSDAGVALGIAVLVIVFAYPLGNVFDKEFLDSEATKRHRRVVDLMKLHANVKLAFIQIDISAQLIFSTFLC